MVVLTYIIKMLKLNRVSKSYEKVAALREVSFQILEPGSLVIFGPSGSGKTTLLRLIAGLEMPDAGEIYLAGNLVSRWDWILPPYKRNIGFVFQSYCLWPHLSVAGNILFGLKKFNKEKAKARLGEVLTQTGLRGLAQRYPDELSGGEARRVALARAIAPYPNYLLMDEPLTNLDEEAKGKLLSLIKETVKQNSTYLIYVTHDLQEAREISQTILVFKDGELVAPL